MTPALMSLAFDFTGLVMLYGTDQSNQVQYYDRLSVIKQH